MGSAFQGYPSWDSIPFLQLTAPPTVGVGNCVDIIAVLPLPPCLLSYSKRYCLYFSGLLCTGSHLSYSTSSKFFQLMYSDKQLSINH